MVQRPTSKQQRRNEAADRSNSAKDGRPRLVLGWYVDAVTGKPAARWVHELPEASADDATMVAIAAQ